MKNNINRIFVFLVLVPLLLSACAPQPVKAENPKPAKVEKIDGSTFKRVTLTEKAAQRLDIQTASVRNELVETTSQRKVVPYAAVMYGLDGSTWVYTNPEPLVFVRQAIVIDHISGDFAVLKEGPDLDTAVVIVGAAELYGAEVGVSK